MLSSLKAIVLLVVSCAASSVQGPPHVHKKVSLAATVPAELLPGNHKLVDQALAGMPTQLHELQQKQEAVNKAHASLRGSVVEATVHAPEAAQIKHTIATKEAKLRSLTEKEHNLQDDSTQIEGAHSALVSSVHQIHDPNVESAQMRLQNKQDTLTKEQEATTYLANQREQVQLQTTAAIQDEDDENKKLVEFKAETAAALKQQDAAEHKAVYDKQQADEEAQSSKYAEEQQKVGESRFEAAEKVVAKVVKETKGRTTIREMEQVADAQRAMRAAKDEFNDKKSNAEHIAAQAAELLKQSELSHTRLVEAQARVATAKEQQAETDKQYKLKQALATKDVRSLKYITTKFEGEEAKMKVAEAAAQSADNSVKTLNSIRANEEEKVHHYLAKGKDKIATKLKKTEAAKEETASEIESLQQKYHGWQEEQLKRSQAVEQSQQESAQASQEYAAGQRDSFTKAQEKVYKNAVSYSKSSWDGQWASGENSF